MRCIIIKTVGIARNLEVEVSNLEFEKIVEEIIRHKKVRQMKKFPHHCDTSCFQHSLNVSFYCYLICKKLKWDYVSAARAGMLHDLFLYDWRKHYKKTGDRFHAMTHPDVALRNAKQYFRINRKEEDIIRKHMWPLTIILPKYKETYVIIFVDKYCGLLEILQHYFLDVSKKL